MIRHIKKYILLWLLFYSIAYSNSNYSFYKAYTLCDENDIEAYTQKEASNLYKHKKIDFLNYTKTNMKMGELKFLPNYKKCINENLNTKVKTIEKYKNVKEKWPFNKIYFINKKYILTAEDGYYFVFINKKLNNTIITYTQHLYKNPPEKTNMYLVKGDRIEILEEKDDWVYILYKGTKDIKAWVPKSAIQ